MIKLILIATLLLSCTRSSEEFVVEKLKENGCALCITRFEQKRQQNCLNDSSKSETYNELQSNSDTSFDTETPKVFNIKINGSLATNPAKLYVLENESDFIYLFIRINDASSQATGDIGSIVASNRVIRLSKTSNSALIPALKSLSCASSDAGFPQTDNDDNDSGLAYSLTTRSKVQNSDDTFTEQVFTFNRQIGTPIFYILFNFTFQTITYDENDDELTRSGTTSYELETSSEGVPDPTVDTVFRTLVNATDKCEFDGHPIYPGNGLNIPFSYPLINCGLSYTIPGGF